MAENGYITQEQADAAKKKPIVTRGQPQPVRSVAPFFTEEVRKYLEQKYGAKALYESGLSVQTGDRHRAAARRQSRGRSRPSHGRQAARLSPRQTEYRRAGAERRDLPSRPVGAADRRGGHRPGCRDERVADIGEGPYRPADRRASWRGYRVGAARTARAVQGRRPDRRARDARSDQSAKSTAISLEQTPLVEGALVAIDNRTGQIRAMVGGFSFDRSKFNRATQAHRQVGSLFKPFVYTAAIDRGYTPTSVIVDEPVSYDPGPGQPLYEPQELRREVRRRRDAAPCARRFAERAGGEDDGGADARSRSSRTRGDSA